MRRFESDGNDANPWHVNVGMMLKIHRQRSRRIYYGGFDHEIPEILCLDLPLSQLIVFVRLDQPDLRPRGRLPRKHFLGPFRVGSTRGRGQTKLLDDQPIIVSALKFQTPP